MGAVLQYQDLKFHDYFFGGTEPVNLDIPETDPDRHFTVLPKFGEQPEKTLEAHINSVCQQLLNCAVTKFEFPGGRGRDTTKIVLQDGRHCLFTRRDSPGVTQREVFLLRRLYRNGAPVPKVLATDGQHYIQEQVGRMRLTSFLHLKKRDDRRYSAMSASIQGLLNVYAAAERGGLDGDNRRLAVNPEWIQKLVDRIALLGQHMNEPAPTPNLLVLLHQLSSTQCRLVKWDARPGNVMLAEKGAFWIDWEDARFRNRLDDLAWLLGDELLPEMPLVESRLLDRYLGAFADNLDARDAQQYFYTYGVLHICTRLMLILSEHQTKQWRSAADCIKYDGVGLHPMFAMGLCQRAARWAERSESLFVLVPWFKRLEARFSQLT